MGTEGEGIPFSSSERVELGAGVGAGVGAEAGAGADAGVGAGVGAGAGAGAADLGAFYKLEITNNNMPSRSKRRLIRQDNQPH